MKTLPFKNALLWVALAAVSPFSSAAPFSLTEAYRMALNSHPSLQQRKSTIEAAEHDVKGAEWKRYPTLSVETSRTLNQPSALNGVNQNAATVRVEQPLYTFGKLTAESDAAIGRQRVAELSLQETEQDLLTRVTQVYVEALRLRERIKIAEANQTEHQRLYDMISRRQDSGVSSSSDMALGQARLHQSRAETSGLKANLVSVRQQLEQLIGAPVNDDLQAVQPPAGPGWTDRSDLLGEVRAFSPTLRRLEAELDLAVVDVAARKAAALPNVNGRYERFAGSAQAVPYDRWMVVLAYQPGAGLSSIAAADAAGSRVSGARSAVEAGTRELIDRASTLFSDVSLYREQMEPATAYVNSAAAVMDSYFRQYAAGRKNWVDVMNAQRELTQAKYALADVQAGNVSAALRLDALAGRLTRATVFGPGTR